MNTYFKLLRICILFITPLLAQAQDCDNNTVIDISGPNTTTWTAPSTGGPFAIQITATGGGGGNITNIFQNSGGHGAMMSGTFIVQNNQTIRAIAGDFGKNATLEGSGAGGGSGAVNCGTGGPGGCSGGAILIIAAGGAGGDIFPGLGGSSLTNGNGQGGVGGGDPDHPNDWGAGGGGLNGSGQSISSGGQGGGQVLKTGLSPGGLGSGNQVPNDGGAGMGGGGGGGDYGAGGGGGHTGGNGGNEAAAKSFNSGSDQSNSDGADGSNFPPGNPPAGIPGTVTVICLSSLPVELTDFKAIIPKNGGVQLFWATASEKENSGFDVERSADGHHWLTLGFIPGNGTTAVPHSYNYTDEHPLPGMNYYRLKQTDFDGKVNYSPMVVADVRSNGLQFDVFPNPSTNGLLSFRTVSKTDGNALLEIFDWAGYKVYKEPIAVLEGTTVWPVSLTTFPKGAYTARLEMPGGEVQFKKIILH